MRKSCLLPTLEQTRMLLSSDFFMFFSVLILIRHLDLSFMQNHSHTHIHIHLSSSCGALPEPPTENVPLTQPFPPQLHQRDVALEWTTVATHRRTSLYMGWGHGCAAPLRTSAVSEIHATRAARCEEKLHQVADDEVTFDMKSPRGPMTLTIKPMQ